MDGWYEVMDQNQSTFHEIKYFSSQNASIASAFMFCLQSYKQSSMIWAWLLERIEIFLALGTFFQSQFRRSLVICINEQALFTVKMSR